MHIMEGYLPVSHSVLWTAAMSPFWGYGIYRLKKIVSEKPNSRLLLGAAGGYSMLLSSLKLPSVTGSSSHLTGVGFGAILYGPGVMFILGTIVLLFQALLLAHGGISTLGANAFSMVVVGGFAAYGVFRLLRSFKLPLSVSVFIATMLSSISTYLMTSLQLAIAHHSQEGIFEAFIKFFSIFAITQIPLAVSEGLFTVLIINALLHVSRDDVVEPGVISGGIK